MNEGFRLLDPFDEPFIALVSKLFASPLAPSCAASDLNVDCTTALVRTHTPSQPGTSEFLRLHAFTSLYKDTASCSHFGIQALKAGA